VSFITQGKLLKLMQRKVHYGKNSKKKMHIPFGNAQMQNVNMARLVFFYDIVQRIYRPFISVI